MTSCSRQNAKCHSCNNAVSFASSLMLLLLTARSRHREMYLPNVNGHTCKFHPACFIISQHRSKDTCECATPAWASSQTCAEKCGRSTHRVPFTTAVSTAVVLTICQESVSLATHTFCSQYQPVAAIRVGVTLSEMPTSDFVKARRNGQVMQKLTVHGEYRQHIWF